MAEPTFTAPETLTEARLRAAGAEMANICFNLSQHEGKPLTAEWCASMRFAYAKWDSLVSAIRAEQGRRHANDTAGKIKVGDRVRNTYAVTWPDAIVTEMTERGGFKYRFVTVHDWGPRYGASEGGEAYDMDGWVHVDAAIDSAILAQQGGKQCAR